MRATKASTVNFDQASKELLKGENIRAGIIKYLIDDYKDMSVNEIKKLMSDVLPSEDKIVANKTVEYDVLFTAKLPNSNDEVGIIIDLEPQGYHLTDEKLISRAFQYCSRLIIRQDERKKNESGNWTYGKLKKVYSIWILTDDKKRRGDMMSIRYQLTSKLNKNPFLREYYDKTEMVFIYPEINAVNEEVDIVSLMTLLFSINVDVKEKPDMLKLKYDIEVNDQEKGAMYGFLDKNDDLIKKKFKEMKAQVRAEEREEHIASMTKVVSNFMSAFNVEVDKAIEIAGLPEDIKTEVIKRISK